MDLAKDDGFGLSANGVRDETEKHIEEAKRAIQQLEKLEKEIISYNKLNDILFTMDEDTVAELRKNITGMLRHYIELLQHHESCGTTQQQKAAAMLLTEKAGKEELKYPPAYKENIDVEEIYRLHQQGLSLRAIAKQVGCSPDTVKRRLEKKQRELSNGD